MTYRQCHLRRATTSTTAWLPSEYAVVGKVLRLKGEDGWVVESVSDVSVDHETAMDRSREWRSHRDVSAR
jgi:hypothetical protein